MVNGHQLSRACREAGYKAPSAGAGAPPAFLVAPTTCARAAVRLIHTAGPAAAKVYFAGTAVGGWVNHSNASMASNAQAVSNGLDWYIAADAAHGCAMSDLDARAIVSLQAGQQLDVRLDVVLDDGPDIAGRVVLWDSPNLDAASAPIIACAFALALGSLYPTRQITSVGVWQARRQQAIEVPVASALAQTAAASAVLANM